MNCADSHCDMAWVSMVSLQPSATRKLIRRSLQPCLQSLLQACCCLLQVRQGLLPLLCFSLLWSSCCH